MDNPVNLAALGASPLALAGLIFGLNSTIKRNVAAKCASYKPPRKEPPAAFWWFLSAVFGVIGALIIHASGFGAVLPLFGASGWMGAVWFGLSAGLIAVIGRDAFKTAFNWFGGETPPVEVKVEQPVIPPTVPGQAAQMPAGFRPLANPQLIDGIPVQQDGPDENGEFPAATQTGIRLDTGPRPFQEAP